MPKPRRPQSCPSRRRPGSAPRSAASGCCGGAIAVADAGGLGVADDPLARPGARRQADVGLPPRRQQGRDPRRHRRPRLRRDRAAVDGRRLAGRDAPARAVGPPGAAAAPLGDRAAGVADHPGPATLRHHDAVIGTLRDGGLLGGDDRPRLRPARQLRLRVRAVQEAALPFDGPDTVAEVAESIMEVLHRRRVPAPASSWRPSTSSSPATTSATSSSSGST